MDDNRAGHSAQGKPLVSCLIRILNYRAGSFDAGTGSFDAGIRKDCERVLPMKRLSFLLALLCAATAVAEEYSAEEFSVEHYENGVSSETHRVPIKKHSVSPKIDLVMDTIDVCADGEWEESDYLIIRDTKRLPQFAGDYSPPPPTVKEYIPVEICSSNGLIRIRKP